MPAQTDMQNEMISRSQQYLSLAEIFLPPGVEAPADVIWAYSRLFLTPGRVNVPLHESVYFEGRLMGEAASNAASLYAKANLQVNTALSDLPDHLSLELAFMAHLISQEDQDHHRAEMWCDYQRHFLSQHLARWLPKFCHRIVEVDAHPHYRQAALAAQKMVTEDLERLSTQHAKPGGQSPEQPPATSQADGARAHSHQNPERCPNIFISVNPSCCTMCIRCTDNCQAGALTTAQTSTELTLLFNPAACNGCRACLRFCPEGAIHLERKASPTVPPPSSRNVLLSAPRVVCPKCNKPHIALPWLERLAIQLRDNEDVRHSLALCPPCKLLTENNTLLYDSLPRESYACD
jgi:TorA maturation chaperone TorD/NAD-dependent dihydropyrimidine dehydrogenase PreA subunit